MQARKLGSVLLFGVLLAVVLDVITPGEKLANARDDAWWPFVPWFLIAMLWAAILVKRRRSSQRSSL